MSQPTPGKESIGHAGRSVITGQRRIEIWDQVYSAAMKPPTHGIWCTREELVAASLPSAKKGLKYNVDDLAEVMRGKKHKKSLGVESSKVDGEWMYRFSKPGAGKALSFKLSPPPPSPMTPSTAATKNRTTARPPATKTKKSTADTPSKPKSKATPTKAKRNTPLRPRPKSPRSASKSPVVAVRASARKRAAATADPPFETPLRPALIKKPRLPSEKRPRKSVAYAEDVEEFGTGGGGGGAVNVGGAEGADGGGSWCVIM